MDWTSARRLELVLRILKRETSVSEAARRYGLPRSQVESWTVRAVRGAERELRPRRRAPARESPLEHFVEYL